MGMATARFCIGAFSRCEECDGSGDVYDHHKGSDTCYDCNGYGYFFNNQRIPRSSESKATCPSSDLKSLIEPADMLHYHALWKNLRVAFKELRSAFSSYRKAQYEAAAKHKALADVAKKYGIPADEVFEVLSPIL